MTKTKKNFGTPLAWWWIYVAGGTGIVAVNASEVTQQSKTLMIISIIILVIYIINRNKLR